jgi:SOS response regulatory protein OraA/RecX|tara:strand:- start:158 stop:325 length:168 start_codon:yes stop_codon:yes gene_type:complete
MSGDIRNIIKDQKYGDKRILDMIKNYLHNVGWLDDKRLAYIYSSIVDGRKAKENK